MCWTSLYKLPSAQWVPSTQCSWPCRKSSGRPREKPPFPRWNNSGTRRDWALGSRSERLGSVRCHCRWANPKGLGEGTPFNWWLPQFCISLCFFLIASAIIGIIFIKEKWKPKDFLSKFADLSPYSSFSLVLLFFFMVKPAYPKVETLCSLLSSVLPHSTLIGLLRARSLISGSQTWQTFPSVICVLVTWVCSLCETSSNTFLYACYTSLKFF